MPNELNYLRRKQLDASLNRLRRVLPQAKAPRDGWIKAIRLALGMTAEQMAKRMGVTQPNIAALEAREKSLGITLQALKKAADALDCDLYYVLIPKEPLEKTLRKRVLFVAKKRVRTRAHSMALEEQPVSEAVLKRQFDNAVNEMMADPPRDLWS